MLLLRAIEAAPSDTKLMRAVSGVVERREGRLGGGEGREIPRESEEATMVGTVDSSKDIPLKDISRRSSWFGGRRASLMPSPSKVLVEIEVVIDEERTATSRP
jgi:hypothetical protein